MCDFQNGTWECRGDGYLWDADSDGYDPNDRSYPCPKCNTAGYLADAKEEAESTSFVSNNATIFLEGKGYLTGADIWERCVRAAIECNEAEANKVLSKIGTVNALTEREDENGDPILMIFIYPSEAVAEKEGGK